MDDIVPPVLACFADQDSRVRYYACESMYNIAKVSKGEILRYFNEVFDAMSKVNPIFFKMKILASTIRHLHSMFLFYT